MYQITIVTNSGARHYTNVSPDEAYDIITRLADDVLTGEVVSVEVTR